MVLKKNKIINNDNRKIFPEEPFPLPLPPKEDKDFINHPPHYKIGSFEVMDIIEAVCRKAKHLEGDQIYHLASCIKYLLRSPFKNKSALKDLQKCKFHLEKLINLEEAPTKIEETKKANESGCCREETGPDISRT